MPAADARTFETIEPLLVEALGGSPAASSFADRIAARVAASLPEGSDVAAIAQASRTLQRRLEQEGTTFSEVLDRARLEVARRALADPARTLTDVAFRLGFADLATFTRAFKRWTGVPPGQWRRS